jgi:phage terminase large subunit
LKTLGRRQDQPRLGDRRVLGYKYGEHYFPHDIMDREFTSGKSRRDALAGMGIEATIVPQSNVLDGINVVRRMLCRTWIDSNRCERGIEALRAYRREWSENLKDWVKAPLHDFCFARSGRTADIRLRF